VSLIRPLVIGIAGGSGSGKTTVARAIEEAIVPESTTRTPSTPS
jgi:uridine kinase